MFAAAGVAAVNVPVVTSADYVFDAAAPGGAWRRAKAQRLNGWFQGLGLGYGDNVYVDGGSRPRRGARLRRSSAPMACRFRPARRSRPAWSSPDRSASSSRAAAPSCPVARIGAAVAARLGQQDDVEFGCGVNSDLAAMVADPEDLLHGREGVGDRQPDRGSGRRSVPLDGADRHQGSPGYQHQGRQVMNAPFQARAGLRDPFTAFVCDDATADMLRPVAVEHGWSPEKVNKGGLRNAVQSLSVSASPNILFVDLSEFRRSAERHQRAGGSLRAGHDRDRVGHRQRRAPVSRPRRQRHPRLSAEAVHGRSAARYVLPRTDDPVGTARRSSGRQAARDGGGDRRSRRRRSVDHRDLARVAVRREGASFDRAARPRRAFRDRRAGARSRARTRPHRRDRKSEPHRRPVHRARHGSRQRAAVGAVGGSADPPAAGDGWHRLLPASGRDAQLIRIRPFSICPVRC